MPCIGVAGCGRTEVAAARGELDGLVPVGEQAVVAHALEAAR